MVQSQNTQRNCSSTVSLFAGTLQASYYFPHLQHLKYDLIEPEHPNLLAHTPTVDCLGSFIWPIVDSRDSLSCSCH